MVRMRSIFPEHFGGLTLLPTNQDRFFKNHGDLRTTSGRLSASPSPLPSPSGRGRIIVSLSPIPESHVGRRWVRRPGLQDNTPWFVGGKNQRQLGGVCARGWARSVGWAYHRLLSKLLSPRTVIHKRRPAVKATHYFRLQTIGFGRVPGRSHFPRQFAQLVRCERTEVPGFLNKTKH